MFARLREWFLETFGERYTQKYYIGHGDFTEENGWLFRGRFYTRDEN